MCELRSEGGGGVKEGVWYFCFLNKRLTIQHCHRPESNPPSEGWRTVTAKVDGPLLPHPQLAQLARQPVDADAPQPVALHALARPPPQDLHRERARLAGVVAVPALLPRTLDRAQEARKVLRPEVDPPDLCLTLPGPGRTAGTGRSRASLAAERSDRAGCCRIATIVRLCCRCVRCRFRHRLQDVVEQIAPGSNSCIPVAVRDRLGDVAHLPGRLVAQLERVRIVDVERGERFRVSLAGRVRVVTAVRYRWLLDAHVAWIERRS